MHSGPFPRRDAHVLFVFDAYAGPPSRVHVLLVANPDDSHVWLFRQALCGEGPVVGTGDRAWSQPDGIAGRPLLTSFPLRRYCQSCLDELASQLVLV